MNRRQRVIRAVTTVVIRAPWLWRVFRGIVLRDFDSLAPTWETRVSDERLLPLLAAAGALPEAPRRVLDVGTGTGRAARALAKHWPQAEVVGVDIAPAMLEEARKLGGGVRYDLGDSERLPYDDGSFDLVTLSNMIPFFDELARVTTPGGHVVIAWALGASTPIYVPLERVRKELERRGFEHVADFAEGVGTSLLARRIARS